VAAADLAAARPLLGRDHAEELAEQVESLSRHRADLVAAADAERRRIERDLHDGVQQRLVALALYLGMARNTVAGVPPEVQEGIAAAHGAGPPQDELHHAMVRAIAWPAGFATLHEDGEAIGFGLAVLERGAVGFYDIVVSPRRRRSGHGRALTQALMHWGREACATSAYLQVREQNDAARRLYGDLGFEDLYRYHYRVPGDES